MQSGTIFLMICLPTLALGIRCHQCAFHSDVPESALNQRACVKASTGEEECGNGFDVCVFKYSSKITPKDLIS